MSVKWGYTRDLISEPLRGKISQPLSFRKYSLGTVGTLSTFLLENGKKITAALSARFFGGHIFSYQIRSHLL